MKALNVLLVFVFTSLLSGSLFSADKEIYLEDGNDCS